MEYLCHYTKQEHAKNIIKNMVLRFGKICESNDPTEVVGVRTNLTLTTTNPLSLQIDDESESVIAAIENYMKIYLNKILQVICFSKGSIKNIEGDVEANIKDDFIDTLEMDSIGVFSKRPPYYLPRMWAQYGENHSGVCLVFNKKRLINQVIEQTRNAYNFIHRDVMYDDWLDLLLLRGFALSYEYHEYNTMHIMQFIHENLEQYSNYCCFTKDIDWKNEREYRFLLLNTIENNNYKNKEININNETLIGVIFGLRNNGHQLKNILYESNIKNILKLKYEDNMIKLKQL